MKIDFAALPNKAPEYDLQQLLDAGCHFGHQARKWHPAMSEWIYMEKEGVHIFDLAKTAEQLRLAYNYLYEMGRTGKVVVLVGTKRQARELVKTSAATTGMMFIYSRWLGGLLTNWPQVSKSLRRMLDIEKGLESGAYQGYTKFERVQLEKEQNRLERFFGGIKTLKKQPDCLVVIDPAREKNAVKEARAVGVPVVALIDSNADPRLVDLPIPANDDALTSVTLIIDELTKAYQAGKAAAA